MAIHNLKKRSSWPTQDEAQKVRMGRSIDQDPFAHFVSSPEEFYPLTSDGGLMAADINTCLPSPPRTRFFARNQIKEMDRTYGTQLFPSHAANHRVLPTQPTNNRDYARHRALRITGTADATTARDTATNEVLTADQREERLPSRLKAEDWKEEAAEVVECAKW
ncbi:MAG: hypothetical protein Q9163_000481 [Psora crenata]